MQEPEFLISLRQTLEKLRANLEQNDSQRMNMELINRIALDKMTAKLKDSSSHYQAMLQEKDRRLSDLEQTTRKMGQEEAEKSKKEIRRYVEVLRERENEIANLHNQVGYYKNKVTNQETEIASLTQGKHNTEQLVSKALEQIRANVKELEAGVQENQFQKIVLEGKIKQAAEKIDAISLQFIEVQSKKDTLQQQFQATRATLKETTANLMEARFQVEQLKEQLKEQKNSDVQVRYAKTNDLQKQLGSIIELNCLLGEWQQTQRKMRDHAQLSQKLIEENQQLRQQVNKQTEQLDSLRIKLDTRVQDTLIRENAPSLYEQLQQKVSQGQQFEEALFRIESYIEANDSQIKKILAEALHNQDAMMLKKDKQLLQDQLLALKIQQQEKEKEKNFLEQQNKQLRQCMHQMQEKIQQLQQQLQSQKALMNKEDKKVVEIVKKKKNRRVKCKGCFFFANSSQLQRCEYCNAECHEKCFSGHLCSKNKFNTTSEIDASYFPAQ